MLSVSGRILGINTFRRDESESGRTVQSGIRRIGGDGSAANPDAQVRAGQTPHARPHADATSSQTPQAASGHQAARPRAPHQTPSYAPSREGRYGFDPIDGELRHDPSDGLIETEYADVSVADFIVSATFENPVLGFL